MKKFLCVILALFTLMLTGCGGGKEVYSGEGYEFAYDPDKWELNFASGDDAAFFSRKGFDEVSLIMGRYRYDIGTADKSNMDIKKYNEEQLKLIEENCAANGFIWDGGEVLNIDGREWYRAEYQQEIGGNNFKYVILFTDNDIYDYNITFTADIDSFDKCRKEFEEIFDSFKFTE